MHALMHAHTRTHPFNGPISRTTRVSRYQEGKTNLDFTEARDSEWHQLGRMQVCISLPTDNHASTPPLSFLQAGCPSCRPTNSFKALKALLSIKCFTMSGRHTHTHTRWNSHLCGRHCWSQKEYQWETLSAICVWWLPCPSHSWLTTLDVDGLLSCNRPAIWIWLQDHQATVVVDHPCWLLAGCSSGGGGAATTCTHTTTGRYSAEIESETRDWPTETRKWDFPEINITRKVTEKKVPRNYCSKQKEVDLYNQLGQASSQVWTLDLQLLLPAKPQPDNWQIVSLKTVHILFHSKP